MGKRFVSGIVLGLLFIGMLTSGFSIGSWPGIWSVHDKQQLAVAATSPMSASAEVRFDPQTYTFIVERGVGAGYRFNTTVELYDVTELFAWQVRVYFNNTLLNATNAYYHPDEPIHKVSHIPLTPVIDNDYNSTHGYVQHGISAIYPNYVNVTTEDYPLGAGICIIEFEVLIKPPSRQTFSSGLSIDNTDTRLRKDPSTIIPCTKGNGLYRLISANIRVPTDYPTIQAAINAAELGNIIFVYNGTYYENVVINKTLMVAGQSADTAIINGTGGRVVKVDTVNYVTIDGFKISSGSDGLYLYKSQLSTISNCIITRNRDNGIFLYYDSNGNTISNCIISENSGDGIYGEGDYHNVNDMFISNNTVTENSGNGVHGYAFGDHGNCKYWVLANNSISKNAGNGVYGYAGCTGHYGGDCSGWKLYHNKIVGNGANGIVGCALTRRYINSWSAINNMIACNFDCGVTISETSNGWTLSGNSLRSNRYGVRILYGNHILRNNNMDNNIYNFGVSGSFIQDVDVSNTVNGKPIYYLINLNGGQVPEDAGYIALVNSANTTIYNHNLSHNEQGIMLIQTKNITLENICASNNIYGIYFQESSNLTVYSSQAINNTHGIYFQGSANCTVHDSKASNNTYGIYLTSSANSTVTGNTLTENDYGIYLSGSSNNTICHNNFEHNNKQVAIPGTIVNVWDLDYPSGGNYWSDHTGPDWCKGIYQNETGSDGIVDSNYTIDQNNVDYYPLSAPWSSPIHIIIPGDTTYRELSHEEGNINLTFTLDFTASWIGYSLDGQANVTIARNTTLTGLSYGWHHIIVYANNTFGNMRSSVRVHFAITFLTDINYDQTVDIDDLVETTWRYGSIPGDPRWNVYADVNQDGIIDIEDIALVADDYGKTWQ